MATTYEENDFELVSDRLAQRFAIICRAGGLKMWRFGKVGTRASGPVTLFDRGYPDFVESEISGYWRSWCLAMPGYWPDFEKLGSVVADNDIEYVRSCCLAVFRFVGTRSISELRMVLSDSVSRMRAQLLKFTPMEYVAEPREPTSFDVASFKGYPVDDTWVPVKLSGLRPCLSHIGFFVNHTRSVPPDCVELLSFATDDALGDRVEAWLGGYETEEDSFPAGSDHLYYAAGLSGETQMLRVSPLQRVKHKGPIVSVLDGIEWVALPVYSELRPSVFRDFASLAPLLNSQYGGWLFRRHLQELIRVFGAAEPLHHGAGHDPLPIPTPEFLFPRETVESWIYSGHRRIESVSDIRSAMVLHDNRLSRHRAGGARSVSRTDWDRTVRHFVRERGLSLDDAKYHAKVRADEYRETGRPLPGSRWTRGVTPEGAFDGVRPFFTMVREYITSSIPSDSLLERMVAWATSWGGTITELLAGVSGALGAALDTLVVFARRGVKGLRDLFAQLSETGSRIVATSGDVFFARVNGGLAPLRSDGSADMRMHVVVPAFAEVPDFLPGRARSGGAAASGTEDVTLRLTYDGDDEYAPRPVLPVTPEGMPSYIVPFSYLAIVMRGFDVIVRIAHFLGPAIGRLFGLDVSNPGDAAIKDLQQFMNDEIVTLGTTQTMGDLQLAYDCLVQKLCRCHDLKVNRAHPVMAHAANQLSSLYQRLAKSISSAASPSVRCEPVGVFVYGAAGISKDSAMGRVADSAAKYFCTAYPGQYAPGVSQRGNGKFDGDFCGQSVEMVQDAFQFSDPALRTIAAVETIQKISSCRVTTGGASLSSKDQDYRCRLVIMTSNVRPFRKVTVRDATGTHDILEPELMLPVEDIQAIYRRFNIVFEVKAGSKYYIRHINSNCGVDSQEFTAACMGMTYTAEEAAAMLEGRKALPEPLITGLLIQASNYKEAFYQRNLAATNGLIAPVVPGHRDPPHLSGPAPPTEVHPEMLLVLGGGALMAASSYALGWFVGGGRGTVDRLVDTWRESLDAYLEARPRLASFMTSVGAWCDAATRMLKAIERAVSAIWHCMDPALLISKVVDLMRLLCNYVMRFPMCFALGIGAAATYMLYTYFSTCFRAEHDFYSGEPDEEPKHVPAKKLQYVVKSVHEIPVAEARRPFPRNNVRWVKVDHGGGDHCTVRATFLNSSLFVTVAHAFIGYNGRLGSGTCTFWLGDQRITVPVSELNLVQATGCSNDLVFGWVKWESFRAADITSGLTPDDRFGGSAEVELFSGGEPAPAGVCALGGDGVYYSAGVKSVDFMIETPLLYRAETGAGYCGSAVVTKQGRLLGIHGASGGPEGSIGIPITRDLVMSVIRSRPKAEGNRVDPCSPCYHIMELGTGPVRSLGSEDTQALLPGARAIANESGLTLKVLPLEAMKKSGLRAIDLYDGEQRSHSVLSEDDILFGRELADYVYDPAKVLDMHQWTVEEAIFSLPDGTSAGYPYTVFGQRLKEDTHTDGAMGALLTRCYRATLEWLHDPAKKVGRVYAQTKVKIESLKPGKAMRVIEMMCMHFLIIQLQAYGALRAALIEGHLKVFKHFACGVNPYSDSWVALETRFRGIGRPIAFDCTKLDRFVTQSVLDILEDKWRFCQNGFY